ncbi:MAG TPA: alpha/beta hydrolase [Streptosporangiaceae bacterium]|nr:alpha/beta hydrolase [Streptosporangiaceae bacterium]
MARWRRLTSVAGIATGVVAAGVGGVIAAEKIAVGRIRLRPDPAVGEPFGQVPGTPVGVRTGDGVLLSAAVAGPEDAPLAVLFCHGFCLNQDVWHYQWLSLRDDFRLVRWDQRGHGRSALGDPRLLSIDQLGADLAAVIAATVREDQRVVLVGHSMGGMTIMALADQQPELFGSKVAGVMLISTAAHEVDATNWLPGPMRPTARALGSVLMRGSASGRGAALTERIRGAGGDLAFLSTRFIAFGDDDVSPTVVDFLERVIRATPIEVVASFYLELLEHDKRLALANLGRVPVVVITGARDRLVPAVQTEALAAAIPGARLVEVPGAGHAIILEQPDAITQEIIELIKEVR